MVRFHLVKVGDRFDRHAERVIDSGRRPRPGAAFLLFLTPAAIAPRDSAKRGFLGNTVPSRKAETQRSSIGKKKSPINDQWIGDCRLRAAQRALPTTTSVTSSSQGFPAMNFCHESITLPLTALAPFAAPSRMAVSSRPIPKAPCRRLRASTKPSVKNTKRSPGSNRMLAWEYASASLIPSGGPAQSGAASTVPRAARHHLGGGWPAFA